MKKVSEIIESTLSMGNSSDNNLTSGIKGLDNSLTNWRNGELILISGRPSMGKTAFMTTLIVNMAVKSKIPVGVFSLVDSENQLVVNLLSNYCKIDNLGLRNNSLIKEEWDVLDKKIKDFKNSDIYIECPPKLLIEDLIEKASSLVKENGVKAIFIDYVQLLIVTSKYSENRYNEMNYISRELKALARELDIPVFVISQMNRRSETERSNHGLEGLKPRLSDLRDSGTLCDDADVVLFIFRPEYYRITEDEQGNSLIGTAEILVKKNRNGYPFNVNLNYKPEYLLFTDIT
jgi:replicative DNA helicase